MLSKLTHTILKSQLQANRSLLAMKNVRYFSRQENANQNEQEETQSQGRQTQAEEEYQETKTEQATSAFRKILRYGWWTFLGLFSYNYYLAQTSSNPENETGYVGPVFTLSKKAQNKVQSIYDFFTKPPVQKLLMDHPPIPGIIPPKTLVINLTGTIIHTEFIFGKGTQIKKRPGLNQLIRRLSHLYEIVIFSEDDLFFIEEVRMNLDPNQTTFIGGFGKESMVYDGSYFKDLKYLNRDLKKVVVLDYNPETLRQYKANGIFLDKFVGDMDDKLLIETIPLLERLADHSIRDVREELKKYGNTNPGRAFIEEMKARSDAIKQRQQQGLGGFLMGGARQPSPVGMIKRGDF